MEYHLPRVVATIPIDVFSFPTATTVHVGEFEVLAFGQNEPKPPSIDELLVAAVRMVKEDHGLDLVAAGYVADIRIENDWAKSVSLREKIF